VVIFIRHRAADQGQVNTNYLTLQAKTDEYVRFYLLQSPDTNSFHPPVLRHIFYINTLLLLVQDSCEQNYPQLPGAGRQEAKNCKPKNKGV